MDGYAGIPRYSKSYSKIRKLFFQKVLSFYVKFYGIKINLRNTRGIKDRWNRCTGFFFGIEGMEKPHDGTISIKTIFIHVRQFPTAVIQLMFTVYGKGNDIFFFFENFFSSLHFYVILLVMKKYANHQCRRRKMHILE